MARKQNNRQPFEILEVDDAQTVHVMEGLSEKHLLRLESLENLRNLRVLPAMPNQFVWPRRACFPRLEVLAVDSVVLPIQLMLDDLTIHNLLNIAIANSPAFLKFEMQKNMFEGLRSLTIRRQEIEEGLFKCIASLPNLQTLAVSGEMVNDKAIDGLSCRNQLVHLGATDSLLTLTSVSHKFPALAKLDVRRSKVSDLSIDCVLQHFPALEALLLAGTSITADGIFILSRLGSLRTLSTSIPGVGFQSTEVWRD